jgi:hypothetical protein
MKVHVITPKRNPKSLKLIRRAIELYSSEYASKEINRANQRKWIRAVQRLGDKWLLANPKVKAA